MGAEAIKMSDSVELENGTKMVRVPLGALKAAIAGVRSGVEQKKRLEADILRADAEAKALEVKLQKRQDQLDKCSAFRPDAPRPNQPRGANPRAFFRQRSRSVLFSSSMRDLVGELADEMNQLIAREDNIRALMDATRDLCQKSEFHDVIGSAIRAAQSVIAAEKYTLGILNEKKDTLELQ
ncbi:hypothetical protein PINS_up023268 [Pythium insidiosum]|nr:hypothetical protein PINS_up023268 [Pythium insidiosum]